MAAATTVANLSSNPRSGCSSLFETLKYFLKCLCLGRAAEPEDTSAVPSSTPDPFAAPTSTLVEADVAKEQKPPPVEPGSGPHHNKPAILKKPAPPSTLVEKDVAKGQKPPPVEPGSGPHHNKPANLETPSSSFH